MKQMVRRDAGTLYYACILWYDDDFFSIRLDAKDVLKCLDDYFKLKPEYLLEPNIYLGSEIRKIDMHNGVWTWGFSSACYVHDSVKNVEKYMVENLGGRWKLPARDENPFAIGYLLDLDESPVLEPFLESYYQS